MKVQTSIFALTAMALLVGPTQNAAVSARSIVRPPQISPPEPGAEPMCKILAQHRPGYGVRPHPSGAIHGRPIPMPSVMAPPPPPSPAPQAQVKRAADASAAASMPAQEIRATIGKTKSIGPPAGRYGIYPRPPQNREQYEGEAVAGVKSVSAEPISTFAVDVDTGAYANVRRFLNQGRMPPAASVRTEEMINYFRYDYPLPKNRNHPFSITTDMAKTPWNENSRLLRVGLRGYDLDYRDRPAANLVFLIDVSGSMRAQNKLPLVKSSLSMLADNIRPQDRVSIVIYSGTTAKLLTPCNKPEIIKQAVNSLSAGGSTAGGQALKLAYATARQNFSKDKVNRIMLATDGDFNVGITDKDELKKYIAKQRDSGITLTALGYGTGNYNEALMEQVANVGNGNYAYIDSAMEAQKVLDEEMSSTLFTIAKDVKIQVEFNPAYVSQYRLIGYENRLLAEEDFDNDKIDAGDIGASHQVTALYEIIPAGAKGWLPKRRYSGNKMAGHGATGEARKNGEAAFIKLRYKLPNGSKSRLIERPLSARLLANASRPRGDMAFATAVAAFGQKLRGDKYLGDYDYDNIRALAGDNKQFWRQEFKKLTQLADSQS